ncbi:MAG: 3-hydroxyacyl-CoA dehydrogenase NAD-binding domain-containing protein [Acidimicrobiia bacterium]|nr:MAG: 3-hydroxyacyl-CoA dehydrogenase NAD-binding domain-containing protein [Acidimicrobiia bacterium]
MGHGIALACLVGSDAQVSIVSRRDETVEHGLALVSDGRFGLTRAVSKGRLTEEQAVDVRSRLTGTTSYEEGLDGADLVFESVPELVDVKHEALTKAELLSPDGAIIATNTSSIMIAELAAALTNGERLIGTHWFYPANVLPLVEVARSAVADEEALESVVRYLQSLGKKPVVVADSPGFFMTRFINNYLAEAIRLVELGIAGPAEVDEMVKTGLGWPMGVFELLDASSFEAFYHAQEYLHDKCGERYAVPPLAVEAYEAGYLGSPDLKPGSKGGWYDFLASDRPGAERSGE